MPVRVEVSPELISWARERSTKTIDALAGRFPRLLEWESGDLQPTLKQLEEFAKATYVPIGYFFLKRPPEEDVPIPDMRTIADVGVVRPSPNLLDTIYICQNRQAWYRTYAQVHRMEPVPLVGSADTIDPVVHVAEEVRRTLGIDIEARRAMPSWEDALRSLIGRIDQAGVMVMVSGVVGSNTHRRLDPDEFRGFALADDLAPTIFINGASSKSAQMFTLAHELAHIALNRTALSNAEAGTVSTFEIERWCNRFAAELLVPEAEFRDELRPDEPIETAARRMARVFKVSTLVVIRRFLDVGRISRSDFWTAYQAEVERLTALQQSGTGGNFYLTQPVRLSKRFTRALISDTLEGRTLYRDAMRLAGIKRVETLHELGRQVGVEA